MASPYGQPQPGYQGYPQPGYGGGHVPAGYPAQHAPYNGPDSAYLQGPPQGKQESKWFSLNSHNVLFIDCNILLVMKMIRYLCQLCLFRSFSF